MYLRRVRWYAPFLETLLTGLEDGKPIQLGGRSLGKPRRRVAGRHCARFGRTGPRSDDPG